MIFYIGNGVSEIVPMSMQALLDDGDDKVLDFNARLSSLDSLCQSSWL